MVTILSRFGASPGDLIQDVSWPGVERVESFTYCVSWGTQPGRAILTTYPQDDDIIPAAYGNLLWTDGYRSVMLRGAMVEKMDGSYSSEGTTYNIHILDRRWRWRNQHTALGGIDGRYNQLDPRGKLVPWSIRSPTELARLCFIALGEFNYLTFLPPGLPRAVGANLDAYLRLGDNFTQTSNNPSVIWDKTPPAEALARLVDTFGCVLVYQPASDRFVILPRGEGVKAASGRNFGLPDGPCEMISPNISRPQTPSVIVVSGAPIRIQARVPLEPVGKEWDGSYLEIDSLSYAPPTGSGRVQKSTVTYTSAADPVYGIGDLTVTWGSKKVSVYSTDPTFHIAQRWADITGQLNGNADFAATFSVSSAANVLTIQGRDNKTVFSVKVSPFYGGPPPPDLSTSYRVDMVQSAASGGRSWESCPIPSFANVIPTERLSYTEAVGLARSSVWRTYRVMLADPQSRQPPLVLPFYGPVGRRQQLVIQPTKVAQVVPQPRIAGGQDKGNLLPFGAPGGVLPEFYNGRSRDQAAVVYGSVFNQIGRVYWVPLSGGTGNTSGTARVWCDFEITTSDTGDQLVVFSDYVYRYEPKGVDAALYGKPTLVLETSFLVTDYEADQLIRYSKALGIPGGLGTAEYHRHEDCQVGIIGVYGQDMGGLVGAGFPHQLLDWRFAPGDIEHAEAAADNYLAGHLAKYELEGGETRQYVGIYPINPDGLIQQVTWRIGPQGPTTIASANSEHNPYIPPYPVRRRPEITSPDRAARDANAVELLWHDRVFPQAASKVN